MASHASTHFALLGVASSLAAATDGDAPSCGAVIMISGAACESAVADAFRRLVEPGIRVAPRSEGHDARDLRKLLASKKPLTLLPKSQRRLWRAMTGDHLPNWIGWIRYVRHIDRSRAMAHLGMLPSGRSPGTSEANEAIDVAASFHEHLEHVVASVIGVPTAVRGDGAGLSSTT